MAFGKLLRSPHAHARILAIDTTRARALPGVYAVITGHDLPRVKFGILPVSQDEEALCIEKVRMVGDAVAAVAAVDEETAERGVPADRGRPTSRCRRSCRSRSRWPIPRCASTSTATGPTSTRTWRCSSATSTPPSPARTSFARTSSSSRATRTCPWSSTPPSRSAAPTASSRSGRRPRRRTTCTGCSPRSSTCPGAHIRVIAAPVGGGFGGKLDPFAHEIAACKLSQLTGRPVKIACTREEVFYVHRGRHPGADVAQDRVHEGRRHHRHALPHVARRRRVRLLRRGLDLLHGRAQTR